MLKIGQNWGKIANYPHMLNEDLHHCPQQSETYTVFEVATVLKHRTGLVHFATV